MCAVEQVCVSVLQRGHYGEVGVYASTMCTYDLRKRDLCVLSWVKVRRLCLESISSVVFYVVVVVCTIVLISRFARCFVTMVVCNILLISCFARCFVTMVVWGWCHVV